MTAYHFICLSYENSDEHPDEDSDEHSDEIIMIGYSRGAFTVRCLVNLIHEFGLLSRRGLANLLPVFDCWWNGGERKKREEGEEREQRPRLSAEPLKECNWHCEPGSVKIKVCGL